MKTHGGPSFGHNPNEKFSVGPLKITMVPVDHAWQNAYPGTAKRTFKNEDCTGFMITCSRRAVHNLEIENEVEVVGKRNLLGKIF
jgi:hypothetical protein